MNIILFLHSAGPQHDEEGSAKLLAYIRNHLSDSYQIIAPVMPDPDRPEYEQWKMALTELFKSLDEETIIIGHSLGGSVLLKFLSEEYPIENIKALYLVAVPFWGIDGWDAEEFLLAENFAEHLPLVSTMVIYHSEDDDIVSVEHAKKYANELPQAEYHLLNGYGHVFWDGLPELIKHIKDRA